MSDTSHVGRVQSQFGAQAQAYLTSAVHAQGPEFAQLQGALIGHADARVLDLGCGAGHLSFQVAPLVETVVAYDLSEPMLAVVSASAGERKLDNIQTQQGCAERLPFASGCFDYVFSRYSAHHWLDLGQALREVRRVLKPAGIACFIDVVSPGVPLLDTHLQAIEVLRDSSHVRDYSTAEWVDQLAEAGLLTVSCQTQRLRLEFAAWVARMATPDAPRQAIRYLQSVAGQEIRAHFDIAADGSFSADVLVVWVKRPSG